MEETQEVIQKILKENPNVVLISFGQYGAIKVEGFFKDSKGEVIPYNLPFKSLEKLVTYLDKLKETENSRESLKEKTPVKKEPYKVRKNIGGFASMNAKSILEEVKK